MTASDINDKTNLPHRVSLGDVLGSIQLAPGEVGAFLADMADRFRDRAHPNLARAFSDHAALVTDPRTYGYQPPEGPIAGDEMPYQPPTAGDVRYGSPAEDQQNVTPRSSLYPGMPATPTGQGQATTPGSVPAPTATTPDVTGGSTTPTGEPAWMAQARAAGWNASNSPSPVSPTSPTLPESAQRPSERASQDIPAYDAPSAVESVETA